MKAEWPWYQYLQAQYTQAQYPQPQYPHNLYTRQQYPQPRGVEILEAEEEEKGLVAEEAKLYVIIVGILEIFLGTA